MIESRFSTALTTCFCTCTVLALILLQSCSGATKIESTGDIPRITTETIEEESKQVLNPETGELEKYLVHRTHTIVTQTSSGKISESELEDNHSDERTDYDYLILTGINLTIILINLL